MPQLKNRRPVLRKKLNRTEIDKLVPPASGYVLVRDSELRGFGLRLTAAGAKTFVVQKRVDGRDRRTSIGSYPALTPEQARKEAQKLLGKIATGIDPRAERASKHAKTVRLKEAFEDFLKARRNLKPRTISDMTYALSTLGWLNEPIGRITPAAVEKRHAELGKLSAARSNVTMRYLRSVLNFAAVHFQGADGKAVLPENPVKRLSQTRAWYRVDRRRTFIKPHELKPWMQAVLALENAEARDYLLILLLTGLRRAEGLGLKWANVDLHGKTLTIPDTKNHEPHTLPLSDYLLGLLTRRKAEARGEYVFEGPRGQLSNLRYVLETVRKASGVDFTPHDLRRTFSTVADSIDVPGYALKALLNHKTSGDVTAGYVVVTPDRLRAPMQKITDYLLAAGGIRGGAEVVALNPRERTGNP